MTDAAAPDPMGVVHPSVPSPRATQTHDGAHPKAEGRDSVTVVFAAVAAAAAVVVVAVAVAVAAAAAAAAAAAVVSS
jgi:hypothetical protein